MYSCRHATILCHRDNPDGAWESKIDWSKETISKEVLRDLSGHVRMPRVVVNPDDPAFKLSL